MLKRFSKSYKLTNKDVFIEKAIKFSSTKKNFVLLNSNDNAEEFDSLIAYDLSLIHI